MMGGLGWLPGGGGILLRPEGELGRQREVASPRTERAEVLRGEDVHVQCKS